MDMRIALVAILCTVTAAPLAAQAPFTPSTPESVVWRAEDTWKPGAFDLFVPIGELSHPKVGEARPGTGTVLLGSAAGWTMGAVAGAALGHALTSGGEGFGAFLGGMAGAGLGAAVGAHLANRSEGSLLMTSLASVGASALVLGTVPFLFYIVATPHAAPLGVGIILTANVGAAVLTERLTSR
jgi:hypothetical protein